MLSHASYPALDPRRIASQSRPIVTDLLREKLGFDGVIVTDSLEAEAVLARSAVAAAAERSIRAGADLILMTGSASWMTCSRTCWQRRVATKRSGNASARARLGCWR